jgi:hypothetical protein
MESIGPYFLAVLPKWWAIVSAFALFGLDPIIRAYWPWGARQLDRLSHQTRTRIEIAIVIAAVFYAGFSAWSDEHEARIAAEQAKMPNLRGELLQVTVSSPEDDQGSSTVLVAGDIRNTGMPSAVTNYKFTVTIKGIQHQGIQKRVAKVRFRPNDKSPYMSYSEDKALYTRTAAPIPQGGIIWGVLVYSFPMNYNELRLATEFVLSFADVEGKTYSATLPASAINSQYKTYPTLEPEVSSQ